MTTDDSAMSITPPPAETPAGASTPGTEPAQVIARIEHESKSLLKVIDESTQEFCSIESRITEKTAEVDRLSREAKNREESIEAKRKYVAKCNHLPELVIDSESGPICCECWAINEKERADRWQALLEANNDLMPTGNNFYFCVDGFFRQVREMAKEQEDVLKNCGLAITTVEAQLATERQLREKAEWALDETRHQVCEVQKENRRLTDKCEYLRLEDIKAEHRIDAAETALAKAEASFAEEKAIVDRVWRALGITTYAQANGLAIDEHVTRIIAERDAAQAQLREARKDSERLDAISAQKLTVTWNNLRDSFIVQGQHQVCGNIGHSKPLRELLDALTTPQP